MTTALFSQNPIDIHSLSDLNALCEASPTGRARLCMHRSPSEEFQAMLIAICPHHYIIPHKNVKPGHILYIIQHGRVIIEHEDRQFYLSCDGHISVCLSKASYRSLRNPDNSISRYWEIHIGSHSSRDIIWDSVTLKV